VKQQFQSQSLITITPL